ncbi:MAG: hypothetical protein EZS28_026995 [Streblomastix strix]|uniref:Uncharacterized protein n=1 Tax=Streblomastix strix TaxID=222440 RepID=A0A5J4V407_9EUKA|nr:MAG: hypothetical protein EZS28_026995 [Streblomastix strix]
MKNNIIEKEMNNNYEEVLNRSSSNIFGPFSSSETEKEQQAIKLFEDLKKKDLKQQENTYIECKQHTSLILIPSYIKLLVPLISSSELNCQQAALVPNFVSILIKLLTFKKNEQINSVDDKNILEIRKQSHLCINKFQSWGREQEQKILTSEGYGAALAASISSQDGSPDNNDEEIIYALTNIFNLFSSFLKGRKERLPKFAYNAFGTTEALGHIFIVFTNCFAFLPNKPNRRVKTTEYRQYVQNFLKEISGAPQVPEIPIFFVDTQDADGYETKQSMIQIHGFALERQTMDSRGFKAVPVHDKIDEQFQVGVFVDYEYEGDTRYKKLIDRKRYRITPYNGDDIRYSNWDVIKSYREAFGTRSRRTETRQRSQEKKNVTHHHAHSIFGSSSNDHTHWEIVKSTWTEARDIITDFDGRVTESDWRIVPGTNKDQIINSGRNGGWSQGWIHSDNIKA